MKINKRSDLFYKKMINRYGHVISDFTIREEILRSNSFIECEKTIVKIYLEELDYLEGRGFDEV